MMYIYGVTKNYILAAFDLFLFSIAAWDGLDHGLRTVAALGALVVLYHTVRKIKNDIELKRLQREREKIELEIKQQELYRLMQKQKKKMDEK